MRIINLTQHAATPEQIEAGVVDLDGEQREILCRWLTFNKMPLQGEIEIRANMLAAVAADDSSTVGDVGSFDCAMIGGAPYLMSSLENALIERDITPLYAFSVRESVEETQPDGSVKKVNTFRHAGFVEI